MSEPIRDPELAVLESALAGLAPRSEPIDRDQLLFRAGQRSVRRGWLWPGSTALLAVVSVALAGLLLLRPGPQTVERVVHVPVAETPHPAPPPPEMAPASVAERPPAPAGEGEENIRAEVAALRLRNEVVRHGVDVIPEPPPPSASRPTVTIEGLLGTPASLLPLKRGDAL